MECWNTGILGGEGKKMEYWNDGMLEYWEKDIIVITHHSIIPSFHPSFFSGFLYILGINFYGQD